MKIQQHNRTLDIYEIKFKFFYNRLGKKILCIPRYITCTGINVRRVRNEKAILQKNIFIKLLLFGFLFLFKMKFLVCLLYLHVSFFSRITYECVYIYHDIGIYILRAISVHTIFVLLTVFVCVFFFSTKKKLLKTYIVNRIL